MGSQSMKQAQLHSGKDAEDTIDDGAKQKETIDYRETALYTLEFCFKPRINIPLGSHNLIQPYAECHNSLWSFIFCSPFFIVYNITGSCCIVYNITWAHVYTHTHIYILFSGKYWMADSMS